MAQNIVEILLKAKDESQPAVQSYKAGLKQIQSEVNNLKRIQQDAAKNVLSSPTGSSASITSRADLKKVTDDLSSAEKELNTVTGALGNTSGKTSGSFRGLFTTFTAASLAAGAIQQGIHMVTQGLKDSVNAASAYNNAMMGLSSTAAAFGISQQQARDSATSLAADGLGSVTAQARGLQNLLSAGLGLPEATQLMGTYKDFAAFGRNETISFDQALINLSQSFKTEQSELGDACLVYDTPIMTINGPIFIGDIVNQRLSPDVLSYDFKHEKIVIRPVINWFDNGAKRSMRVYLKSGVVIEGTFDHKLYNEHGHKVQFEHLCLGQKVLSSSFVPNTARPAQLSTDQQAQNSSDVSFASTLDSSRRSQRSARTAPRHSILEQEELQSIAHQHAGYRATTVDSLDQAIPTGATPPKTSSVPDQDVSTDSCHTPPVMSPKNIVVASAPVWSSASRSAGSGAPTGKEKTPYDTGEASCSSHVNTKPGESRSSSEIPTPVKSAASTEGTRSKPITSDSSLHTPNSPLMSTTEKHSVPGVTDNSMDASAASQTMTLEQPLPPNSANVLPVAVDRMVTGTLTTTSVSSLPNSAQSLAVSPELETSTGTCPDCFNILRASSAPFHNSMSDSDWSTLPQRLAVQFDEVILIEEIGIQQTYNITVSGEHNYFLGDSLNTLTLTANSGMTDNYSSIIARGAEQLGKNANQLTATERAQAKFNGTLAAGARVQGDASTYAETYAGKLARIEAQTTQAQVAIGSGLQPAIGLLVGGFGNIMGAADATGDTMKYVQMYIASLAVVIRSIVDVVVGGAQVIFGALTAIATMSWKPLEDALNQSVDRQIQTWGDFNETITDIAEGSYDTQKAANMKALDEMTKAQKDALEKMNEQIADENKSFARSQSDRLRQFRESMTDMIISHRDKSRSLQNDLASENAAYAKSNAQRQEDLNGDLLSMEEDHAEKVADINEQMAEERNSGLVVDGVLYRDANQKKLDDLQRDLDEEVGKYQAQVDKRKATYDADVVEDQVRHDAKLSQLQTELDSEMAILNTHKDEVAAVGEAQKESDLSRLVRQYQEAGALADQDHRDRLAKIQQQSNEQGSAAGSGFNMGNRDALLAGQGDLRNVANQAGNLTGAGFADGIKSGLEEKSRGFNFTAWAQDIGTKMRDALAASMNWIDKHTGAITGIKAIANLPKNAMDLLAGALFGPPMTSNGRASGGPVTAGQPYVVGEREPELFVPRQSGQILNGDQIRAAVSGGQQQASRSNVVNIGTVINQSNLDPDAFFRSLSWELR